jgi:Na+-transporting NADH:ubiquinone oxidoreductase subunit A
MATFTIRKGRDITIKGSASKTLKDAPMPRQIAIQPQDFRGIKPRPLVKAGDAVKVGTPLLEDKTHPEIKIVSPASGKVSAINRGEKRVLLQVVIDTDGTQDPLIFNQFAPNEIKNLSREKIIMQLLEGGVWPFIRQRPFSKVAHPQDTPKAIFIQAMNTEPLALDIDSILGGKETLFQIGLNIIKSLTPGKLYLCFSTEAKSKALLEAQNVEKHQFEGPPPAGNISTFIHNIDPIKKGDIVWYLSAQDVLRIAHLFLNGTFLPDRYVAVTGEGAQNRNYFKSVIGAPLNSLVQEQPGVGALRYISGSILTGTNVGKNGFLCFYDTQVTIIPEGGKRYLLGWLSPGLSLYSFSKTFVSSFLPQKEVSVDTDTHGSHRAIVMNHIYDELIPLDIMTFFLLKAVLVGDVEEAEKLGILECDEEDFALCSFACPSKTDVGAIIREGLDTIDREG